MKKVIPTHWEFEKFLCYIFNFIAVIMFAVLFYYCLRYTGDNIISDEYIYLKADSVIGNILLIIVALLILYFIGKISGKLNSRKVRNVLLGIVCVLSAAISFYWVYASNLMPEADQAMICWYANAFNMGDFSGFNRGEYLARNPQQLGMITLLKGLFLLFGESNYQAFQYLSAAFVSLIVLSGCKIVRILSDDNVKTEIYYVLFIIFCFPMYIYSTFVYGDLIATAISLFGVWMYLSCLKNFSWIRLIFFSLSMGLAVQLRTNLVILVIALAIVMLIKLLSDWKWQNFALATGLVLGVAVTYLSLWGIYSDVTEEKGPAIPAMLYIVMGLNDVRPSPGWFTGYNYNVFAETGDDVVPAQEIARMDLERYLQLYNDDPAYMINFFSRKMNAQWNAPMYQCIAMNGNTSGPKSSLAEDILNYGSAEKCMEFVMKLYQMLMYGSILVLLVIRRKQYVQIEKYLLLITVFGGLLFSLIWEAKTRYVLPFLFMQIPYMASGICEGIVFLEKGIKEKLKKKSS